MLTGKYTYKAHLDGSTTIEQQIEQVNRDSINGGYRNKDFSECLKYDITRTVANIFGNSVITYNGNQDEYCQSLQGYLLDIYFALHDNGRCFLTYDNGRITGVNKSKGMVEIIDPAYRISKITQKQAAAKQLEFFGVVTNVQYSVLDERGMFGVFSPQKGEVVKESQKNKIYDSFKEIFGAKKGQRKFAITEIPMIYSGVNMPVKDLDLIENEKRATARVARVYGIQEDMILSGSTFDNKENAIIQTYTDYKGLIYDWITQIENELLASFRIVDGFDITFPGVPQMNKTDLKPNEIPLEALNTLTVNEKRELIGFDKVDTKQNEISMLSEKLGVGGTQSMLNILIDATMSDAQKRGALKVLFSLNDTDIEKLIPTTLPQ